MIAYKNNGVRKKGLRYVHIGEDIWSYNMIRCKPSEDPSKAYHLCIYGPNKTYHLYSEDIRKIVSLGFYTSQYKFLPNGAVKNYILSHILDNPEKWNFFALDYSKKVSDEEEKLKNSSHIMLMNGKILAKSSAKLEAISIAKNMPWFMYFINKERIIGYKNKNEEI